MTYSKIEWTDRSDWNPIRGCTRISPGCGGPGDHGGCYAEAMAARFSDPGQWGHGFAERTAKGGRWTGEVAIQWNRIDLPLRWKKAAKIFASSTSDFFHAALQMEDIAQLFGVMIAAHHLHGHIFQVLTKRADIMRAWLNNPEFWDIANAAAEAYVMERVDPLDRRSDDARATLDDYFPENPPPGIWLGVSVEDQPRADERIPDLLATPAAVRFISAEPLLGPVDISPWIPTCYECGASCGLRLPVIPEVERCTECGEECGPDSEPVFSDGCPKCSGELEPVCPDCGHYMVYQHPDTPNIDWVIVGGESGPGARPMHPDWARSLRDQCAAAGVPFHFKQWGNWSFTHAEENSNGGVTFKPPVDLGINMMSWRKWEGDQAREPRKGESVAEWFTPGPYAIPVGKKAAGRLLDGIEHNGFPEAPHG